MLAPSDQVTAPSADTVASQSLNDALITNQQNIVKQTYLQEELPAKQLFVRLRAMKVGSRAEWWKCFDVVWDEGKDKVCLSSCVVVGGDSTCRLQIRRELQPCTCEVASTQKQAQPELKMQLMIALTWHSCLSCRRNVLLETCSSQHNKVPQQSLQPFAQHPARFKELCQSSHCFSTRLALAFNRLKTSI
jgi:hypothetical protein